MIVTGEAVHALKENLFSEFSNKQSASWALSSISGSPWCCVTSFGVFWCGSCCTLFFLHHFCHDTCSSLRLRVSFNFQVTVEFWWISVLTIFVMTLVLHWGGRSVSTSRLQLNSGSFCGMHNYKKSWWVHVTCFCCPIQLSVNAPCFSVFLIDRTIHGVDCSCMNQNLEVGRGRWCTAWLLVGCCWMLASWWITNIHLFSFEYYIWNDLSIISICSSNVKQLHYSIKICCLAGFTRLSNILFRFLSLNSCSVDFCHLA